MSYILKKLKRVFSLSLLVLLVCPNLLIQNILAAEPQGIAKDYGIDLQNPVTEVAQDVYSMHAFVTIIMAIITLFVLGLLIWVCFKYSAKKNKNPSKTVHNTLIEILWTAIPVLILVVIAVPSFKLLYKQDVIPEPDLTIKAIGYQWYWGYEYPDENIIFESYMIEEKDLQEGQPRLLATDNVVVVPVNKVVKVLITANDVLHAWALPAFGVKRDAMPGRVNETWFRAEKVGTYYGQCSELCGIKHAFMPIEVRVVSDEDYQIWLSDAKIKFAKDENLINKKLVASK